MIYDNDCTNTRRFINEEIVDSRINVYFVIKKKKSKK